MQLLRNGATLAPSTTLRATVPDAIHLAQSQQPKVDPTWLTVQLPDCGVIQNGTGDVPGRNMMT
ncbi:UNVERIFIED_CONTAM: hypothetical protein NY603_20365, partial [Bacteroidetes bacterium 56_B9]